MAALLNDHILFRSFKCRLGLGRGKQVEMKGFYYKWAPFLWKGWCCRPYNQSGLPLPRECDAFCFATLEDTRRKELEHAALPCSRETWT